nr:MAG TPA: hypothetical protein [Caudoviricetes sp.]
MSKYKYSIIIRIIYKVLKINRGEWIRRRTK